MEQKITKWEDCGRDDLSAIPFMVENGFTVNFSYNDKRNKRTDINNIPHDAVNFSKGDLHVWKLYNHEEDGKLFNWVKAKLINGHYTDHVKMVNIKNMFK